MFKVKYIFWFLIIIIFSVLASRDLLKPGYFPMHDDLQMMRQLSMEKCFLDGQIPCRWVSDMGYGFGYPLFNFYPPLPYLFGEIFRLFAAAFTTTARLTFALSFFVSGVGMFLLAKEFFGRLGGLVAAIFYIWAPYHAVDVYVRGAMNEAWALVFFPLILWTSYKLISCAKKEVLKWSLSLAISYTGLLLSHNLMFLIFTPVFAGWILIHLWQKNAWGALPRIFISSIWALGLSAFFTLPAIFENNLTQIRSQIGGYYDFTAHFVGLKQLLISRFWGYGPSVFGDDDGMPFPVGHLHWIVSILAGLYLTLRFIFKKGNILFRFKEDHFLTTTLYLFIVGWASVFLTHPRSIFIWTAIPSLSYLQFPWRFLTITTFGLSFVAGTIPGIFAQWKIRHKFLLKFLATAPQIFTSLFLVLVLLILNWNYFRVERIGPVTDAEKFSGEAWRLQQTAGIYDYLPKTAQIAPQNPRKKNEEVEVMTGNGVIRNYEQGSSWAKFGLEIKEDSQVRINILSFPKWKVFIDGKETQVYVPDEEKWGRMWVRVPKGDHLILAQLYNTPVRTIGNFTSLVSWAALFGIFLKRRLKKAVS